MYRIVRRIGARKGRLAKRRISPESAWVNDYSMLYSQCERRQEKSRSCRHFSHLLLCEPIMNFRRHGLIGIVLLLSALSRAAGEGAPVAQVASNLIVFNDNGAWCWYQDPRILVDTTNRTLLIGSIPAPQGPDGQS